MPWVILDPSAAPDDVTRRVKTLPRRVAACVAVGQCEQSAAAAISLSGGRVLLLDRASESCLSQIVAQSSSRSEIMPCYFTFTSGSSGSPRSVECSGSSLWARLLTQLSPSVPLQGLVPSRFKTADRDSLDWREFLGWCATASSGGAAGGSVCVWKTATEFCDTVVEMLQGVTHGATQVIVCGDGSLSSRCSRIAAALCGQKSIAECARERRPSRFDVQRLFREMRRHRVSHITAVPSLIAALLALEESCCPLLRPADLAHAAAPDRGCLFQSLRVMGSSGEALHCSLVQRLRLLLLRHGGAKLSLVNVYGCAETTADASCVELTLPDDKCQDVWGATVPLGAALRGSRIGLLMFGAGGSLARVPAAPDGSCAPLRISWLHDAAAPMGAGRIVVGGACVATGYAQRDESRERLPELSCDLLAAPPESFFARVRDADDGRDVPVFVTLDVAEIVAEEGGKRQLLYRGRHTADVVKIRGVFVSSETVEGALQSIGPLRFAVAVAAECSGWDCCAKVSVVRATFADDALILFAAFDCVVDPMGSSAPRVQGPAAFTNRHELHQFLCASVQAALKKQLRPESVPTRHNISLYCTNIFLPAAEPDETIARCAEVLPPRAPLLSSGKLDVAAACKRHRDAAEAESDGSVAGASRLALAIASCAREALGAQAAAPPGANFFDLGIDSLTGTKLLVAVQALAMHRHRHIPYEMLLQNPSANALASALSSSSSGSTLLTCPPLFPCNSPSAVPHEPVSDHSPDSSSPTRSSNFSLVCSEDMAETRIIEWLPQASVRLWKMRDRHWESRIACSSSVAAGGYSDCCQRLERARWRIDMGACVDASPLLVALRAGEFGLARPATLDELAMLPGFRVLAIVGSHAGLVVAAELATGEVVWSATLPDRVEPGASSAVLHPPSASVLVGCYDGCLYGLCICKGVIRWKFDTNDAFVNLRAPPSEPVVSDLGSAKRPKIAGKEELLNPEKEPLKGGVCLIGCSCCVASSTWSVCGALVGVAGYSKTFFAIQPAGDGSVRKAFSCEVAGSVVAPLLSCHCCCSGGKSRVIVAATSGWLTCFSVLSGQQCAEDWSVQLGGPLFASPVCLVSCRSPLVAVASATGQLFLISVENGQLRQRLQPLETPSSFMSAPRVVFSTQSRVVMLLSAAGSAGILVFECAAGSVLLVARLFVPPAGSAPFISSPCVYRADPLAISSEFVALAFSSHGTLYAAAVNCEQLQSLKSVSMSQIFEAGCGVFCSPSVIPASSRHSIPARAPAGASMPPQSSASLVVVMGGRDNAMRCLQ